MSKVQVMTHVLPNNGKSRIEQAEIIKVLAEVMENVNDLYSGIEGSAKKEIVIKSMLHLLPPEIREDDNILQLIDSSIEVLWNVSKGLFKFAKKRRWLCCASAE